MRSRSAGPTSPASRRKNRSIARIARYMIAPRSIGSRRETVGSHMDDQSTGAVSWSISPTREGCSSVDAGRGRGSTGHDRTPEGSFPGRRTRKCGAASSGDLLLGGPGHVEMRLELRKQLLEERPELGARGRRQQGLPDRFDGLLVEILLDVEEGVIEILPGLGLQLGQIVGFVARDRVLAGRLDGHVDLLRERFALALRPAVVFFQ